MIPAHFTVAKNIVLAEIPFFLALYLFVIAKTRTALWWILCLVFIAFLPNSAYTLTDIIHFIGAVQEGKHSWAYLAFVLLPLYLLFMIVNFQFYVISIMLAQNYIRKEGYIRLAKWFIPLIHFACALGVYLGRVQRLESKNIIEKPLSVLKDVYIDLTSLPSLSLIIVFFVVFYGLYEVFAAVNRRIWKARFARYWDAIQEVKKT